MGQSFDIATPKKSAAAFGPDISHVYDQYSDLHYQAFFDKDSLYIKEYRLLGTDTTFARTEHIQYIIGSGQHTNSHIIEKNGYLYQAPITYYTQKKIWDMAPGFENGANKRFDRKIQLECMSCHNAMPELQSGSLNKFLKIGHGIDCERCHGPGSLHVKEKEAGDIVDTSIGPDFSIVNPRRLSTDQKNNICMRCHLQGVTVLEEGKTFYDFKPSLILSDYMTTFLPVYQGREDKIIMASHVERMMMSKCYTVSGQLACINCHDPHISVTETSSQQFNTACRDCHQNTTHVNMDMTAAQEQECISCHMPKSGSIDIPHVAVTDHYIRIEQEGTEDMKFTGIKSYNNPNPNHKTISKGYLQLYEKYIAKPILLDSAQRYLPDGDLIDQVRLDFLREDFNKVYKTAKEHNPKKIDDAWTLYRLGEACFQKQDPTMALSYFRKASAMMPYVTEFKLKEAVTELILNDADAGVETLQSLTQEDPNNYLSFYNLAIFFQKKQQHQKSQEYMNHAKKLNPDL